MEALHKFGPLVGRIMLSAIFLMSGFGKITDFGDTVGYMESAGMPMASILLVGAIILEFAGGIMLLVGYKAAIGAAMLIVFTVPATLIFHFDFGDQMQTIMFMKNLAIMGGLLFVASMGSGPMSVDKQ